METGNVIASVCCVSCFSWGRYFLGGPRSRSSRSPAVQAWTCTPNYLRLQASQEPIAEPCHRRGFDDQT